MGINDIGSEKLRGKENRKRKPVLLIAVEGKNKTEKNYLTRFGPYSKYAINFDCNTCTDPVNLIQSLIKETKNKKLNFKDGDRAICIFDTDMQVDNKQNRINIALTYQNNMVETIISCPCIETWFLCHYIYSTKEYASNKKVLTKLRLKIPGYSKERDIFDIIFPMTNIAIQNAKKLEAYHLEVQHNINSFESNPSSQLYKLIERILGKQ